MLKLSQIWPVCTIQPNSCVLLKYLQPLLSSFLLSGTKCSRLTLYSLCLDLEPVILFKDPQKCLTHPFCFSFQTCKRPSFCICCIQPIHKHFNGFLLVLNSFSSQYQFYPRLLLEVLNSLCYLCVGLRIASSLFPRSHTGGYKRWALGQTGKWISQRPLGSCRWKT